MASKTEDSFFSSTSPINSPISFANALGRASGRFHERQQLLERIEKSVQEKRIDDDLHRIMHVAIDITMNSKFSEEEINAERIRANRCVGRRPDDLPSIGVAKLQIRKENQALQPAGAR